MFSSNTFSSCDAGMELNTSPISVDEAIQKVLLNTKPLPCREVRVSCDLIGRYLAEDIHAPNDHPQFPTSIMDGYAVCAPAAANVPFIVKGSVHAGQEKSGAESEVQFEETAYITTGARLPVGANAVIKIEDVTLLCANDGKSTVIFNHDVHPGENVREIGSDLKKGDLLLAKGQKLRPSELGLLSTAGLDKVLSYSSPVVGVLSTGDELVEPTEHVPPGSTKIRDCNRLVLLSALKEDGLATVDLGIVRDDKELVRARLLHAADICDVVISSGGVSMGAADYIKPLLGELGHILFGKLNMKPGKPTTFAIMREVGVDGKETLFFGLPGNPVSCIVTKSLFVDPAVKRLQGNASDKCLHTQLTVELAGSEITLDPERPEYHRAIVVESEIHSDKGHNRFLAFSTGNQRSSRILSMKSANALLFLPQGPGRVSVGTKLTSLLIGPLQPPCKNFSVHQQAAEIDYKSNLGCVLDSEGGGKGDSFHPTEMTERLVVKVGLLTISDRAAAGVYEDCSGPEMERQLVIMMEDSSFPLKFEILSRFIVPDDANAISETIMKWTGKATEGINDLRVDLLLTSGGTGFGLRDITPEAIKPLLHREAPGVAQALLQEGLKHTPLAVLSRPVVGTRNNTLICTFPGSVKAIRENMACMKTIFPRIFELLLEAQKLPK